VEVLFGKDQGLRLTGMAWSISHNCIFALWEKDSAGSTIFLSMGDAIG